MAGGEHERAIDAAAITWAHEPPGHGPARWVQAQLVLALSDREQPNKDSGSLPKHTVKSEPQWRCACPATPSSAAEMEPVVTLMFIQCRKVRSLAAAGDGWGRGVV